MYKRSEFEKEVARNVVIGKKTLCFEDRNKCEDFIKEFGSIFIGKYNVEELTVGIRNPRVIYSLTFVAKHSDAYDMYDKINLKTKIIRPRHRDHPPYGVSRRFVV